MLGKFVEIEGVQRVAQLEHHVVRHIHHVVDRFLSDRFQALPQPVRRRLHLHSAQHPRRETPAQIAGFNIHVRRLRCFFRGFFQFGMQLLQRQAVNRRHFARNSQMAQAVRTVGGNFSIQHRPGDRLFDRVHGNTRE